MHRDRLIAPILRGAARLKRDQAGSMVIFSLFIFALMVAMGGLGIDLMRYEARRAKMQATLDRAALAAADLQQQLAPESVVRDYFAKAGLSDGLKSVNVIQTLNSRTVQVEAEIELDTYFMHMLGVPTLPVPALGTAIESVTDLEIGLVLDVSGSMGSNGRIGRLRDAGTDFIDLLFANTPAENLTFSVVPYSTQVNLGQTAALLYGVAPLHPYHGCVQVPSSTYNSTAMPLVGLLHSGHFDPDSSSNWYGGMGAPNKNCRTDAAFKVLPWSNDKAALKSKIENLTPGGWTSIEMGVNWGAALLDASARPVLNGLITEGEVDASFAGRPFGFLEPDVMKVLVVMTDGENTRDYEIDLPYRTGLSDVWLDGSDDYYVASIEQYNRDGDWWWNEPFYRAKTREWVMAPQGRQLTWPELFERISVEDHAVHLRYTQYWDRSTRNYWRGIESRNDKALKDQRLSQICSASKDNGIVIFTIGFEVNDAAAEIMRDCASSPAHFYRAEGLQLASAFTSIATQINELRLVQ
ncbi:Flp pilus assembly protein TadG [Limimaricola pyoseonensis]|uniref:Flp pilus assembly protein TadG n=1 Tax=Limimaricola pyoseonensis TaxID=521013 RepID=A0A1G7CQX5_9RHOB|nr:Flp pilus assembly protein TadG [Limimaricola pyoseonensis]